MRPCIFFGVAIVATGLLMSQQVSATQFSWHWDPGEPDEIAYNSRGGTINSIDTTFDTSTNLFTWSANMSEAGGPPAGRITNGFTLVLNDGPMPTGPGEYATLFFDATGPMPVLTAYGYNGTSLNDSWFDGSNAGGVQPPDQIISSILDMTWINDLFVTEEPDGSRTLGFSIDATAINSHIPLYGNPADWFGIGFDSTLGVWFHPYAEITTDYESGFLSDWDFEFANRGWFDATDIKTDVIPAPSAIAIMLLGLGGLARRRNRSTS